MSKYRTTEKACPIEEKPSHWFSRNSIPRIPKAPSCENTNLFAKRKSKQNIA